MLAYQQLGELYQAARLLVNAFQPSMKLQSRQNEGEYERRIYDDAKTPWQRVLLSDVLSDEIEQQWRKDIAVLDPLRLVQHVETLQRAVWRCSEGGFGKALVRFSLDACVSAGREEESSETRFLCHTNSLIVRFITEAFGSTRSC